jgi:hypothetical protein
MSDSDFNQDFVKSYDQMSVKYDNLLILGDLNYDLLSDQKSTPLTNVCDICDLENIVKCATCFTSIFFLNVLVLGSCMELDGVCSCVFSRVCVCLQYLRRMIQKFHMSYVYLCCHLLFCDLENIVK